MAMIEINKDPSRRELLWFGVLFALFFGLVGGILIWKFEARTLAYWLWASAACITVLYFLLPPLRRPLYLGWIYAVLPIGWTISHLLLALIYYLLFTPIGLLIRVVGYDPMERKFEASKESYWKAREQQDDVQRYFRQF